MQLKRPGKPLSSLAAAAFFMPTAPALTVDHITTVGRVMTHRSRSPFEQLLDEQGTLVADGGMGTSLFDRGLESGASPELMNLESPSTIASVQRDFVEAGADIILTNTFGGNRLRLALHGLETRVREVNEAAVSVARSATAGAGRPVVVAGSIGPTGDLFAPLGPLTNTDAVSVFSEQAEALAAAGVDVLWIETMSSIEELSAAHTAAVDTGVPVVTTMSFDTNGHTMMGVEPGELGRWLASQTRPPAAVGANCGVGLGDVVDAVLGITAAAPGSVVVAKSNCGIPAYTDGTLRYPEGPQDMASYVDLAMRAGARIIGTCCGSTAAHVKAVRAAVDAHEPSARPTRAEIESRLGLTTRAEAGSRRRRFRRRSGAPAR